METEAIPFLSMNGRGNEALNYYTKQLQAKVVFKQTYADVKLMGADLDTPVSQDEWISHSVIELPGGAKFMLNEVPLDQQPVTIGNTQSICLQSQDRTFITDLYSRFTEDDRVTVIQPLMTVPFSDAYGIVRDPFGIIWQLFATQHAEF